MSVAAPAQEVIDAIIGPSTQWTRRVAIYESDSVTLWNAIDPAISRITDGSISVDYTRDERRTLDITLDNLDDSMKSHPGGFWYDKIIKVYRGITYTNSSGSQSWECQLGEFMIDRIDADNFPALIKVTGRDYTKKMLQAKMSQATTFTSGQAPEVIVAALAGYAGCNKRTLVNSGTVTNSDYTFDKGTSCWDAAKQICVAFNYELYFDALGYLIMRDFLDPSTSPAAFTFKTGFVGTIVTYSKSTNDSQMYNHVAVTGNTDGDGLPPFAEIINDEPSSPTNIYEIGDRLYEYDSQFITTNAQALAVAKKFLAIHGLEAFEIDLSTLVLPWLDVGSIINFLDPDGATGDPFAYLLTSLTIPLPLAAMSAVGNRVTIVSSGTVIIGQPLLNKTPIFVPPFGGGARLPVVRPR